MANDLDTAEQLQQQAIELCEQDNYREALPLLHQVRSLTERVQRAALPSALELDSFERAKLEASMALFKRRRALRQSVQERLEAMLLLLEQTPEQPERVQCLHGLAELYRMEHKYAQALPFYERTLAIWEKTLDSEHPDMVQGMTHLAFLLWTQKKYAEAQPLLENVLPIQEKQLGPEHPDVAETLSLLGSVYFQQGEKVIAAAFYERALAIQEKVFGPEDHHTTHIVSNLAYVYQMQGEYAKALSLYERFLVVFEAYIAAHSALLDKMLAGMRGNRSLKESQKEYMDQIVEIYRKNRDFCRAQLQQTN